MKVFICCGLIVLALGLSINAQVTKQTPSSLKAPEQKQDVAVQPIKLSEDDTIREIIFIHILEPWISNKRFEIYYLAVDDTKDPSENLFKRLGSVKATLRKVSESYISDEGGGVVLNKITDKQGVVFSISKLTWKGKDEVAASAGSYIGNMGGDDCKYTLKREEGEWKITSANSCVVS